MTPVIERFLSKISIVDSGCWEWTGCKFNTGYGQIKYNCKRHGTHRFIYEYYYGEVDPNLVIDHLCKNRACVNPLHLEQVTNGENVLRGQGACAVNARRTHCIRGHEFNEENSRIELPKMQRRCLVCQRLRQQNKL